MDGESDLSLHWLASLLQFWLADLYTIDLLKYWLVTLFNWFTEILASNIDRFTEVLASNIDWFTEILASNIVWLIYWNIG